MHSIYSFQAFPDRTDRCVQREAQASVIRELIENELTNNKNIIVFGDMNDYSDTILDVENNVPISRVMRIIRDGLNFIDEQGQQNNNHSKKAHAQEYKPYFIKRRKMMMNHFQQQAKNTSIASSSSTSLVEVKKKQVNLYSVKNIFQKKKEMVFFNCKVCKTIQSYIFSQ